MANRPAIADLDEFARLDAEGTPDAELAVRFGCSKATVIRTRKRLGLPPRRTFYSQEELARFAELLADGWSHAEICRTTGVDDETLRRHFPGSAWTYRERDEYVRTLRKCGELADFAA